MGQNFGELATKIQGHAWVHQREVGSLVERVQAQGDAMHSLGAEAQAHRATLSTLAQQLAAQPVLMESDEPPRLSPPRYATVATSTGTIPEK